MDGQIDRKIYRSIYLYSGGGEGKREGQRKMRYREKAREFVSSEILCILVMVAGDVQDGSRTSR